ncbi:hypothetical protein CSA56_17740 [candidate division KSB3 bacterium]|uniref:Transglycosylase SLT domain-containing protein n=1 Tax=candidate division KSB3 bacterium TaxID=2044937 RepID=A0A2G6K7C8_9BACT|nr:MAG: hypothetical protein CSA56_17740 [candidate division KSB3 bacterium]
MKGLMNTYSRHIRWYITLGVILLTASSCGPPPVAPLSSQNQVQPFSILPATSGTQVIYFVDPVQKYQDKDTCLVEIQAQQKIFSQQLDSALAQAAAHIHAGDDLLNAHNVLEAVREYERARILIEQRIDPILTQANSQANIQGGSHIFSTSKIQAVNVLRTDMLNRINRSYDFREIYGERQTLDKIDQLRNKTRSQLKSISAPTYEPDMRGTRRIWPLDSRIITEDRVNAYITRFQRRGDDFSRCLRNAERYFPRIISILASERIPEELAYVALVSSCCNPSAISSSGRVGLWQLSRSVARRYGLRVTTSHDDRCHVDASTRAFAKYMNDLYYRTGSWDQALIEYAAGDRDFPAKLEAAKAIAQNPQRYGFHAHLQNVTDVNSLRDTGQQAVSISNEPPIGMGTTY